MANGNGDGLFREMFATKERGAAWLTRGLIVVLFTVCGWLVVTTWTDLKSHLDENAKSTWNAIGESNKAVSTLSQTVNGLAITVQDHIREDAAEERKVDDHESRIRVLERTSH